MARFLAEMLDNVGLLSQGNEEMARFAWKSFAQWQERGTSTDEEKQKKEEMRIFLQEFRETFSRPVRRIRFLGLFDTVNSVPRFENAWMQRSKFPYTAKSSAKVIRHAVSIDERRAKFRQDLISETRHSKIHEQHLRLLPQGHKLHVGDTHRTATAGDVTKTLLQASTPENNRYRRPSRNRTRDSNNQRSRSPAVKIDTERGRNNTHDTLDVENLSVHSSASSYLPTEYKDPEDEDDEDERAKQDIEEVWFPGCHADLGGGWPLEPGEDSALSHCPLVWMVREAQHAGLEFDSEKMLKLGCCDDNFSNEAPVLLDGKGSTAPPQIQVTRSESENNIFNSPKSEKAEPGWATGMAPGPPQKTDFHRRLEVAAHQGKLHDCLQFNNGLPAGSVISWKMMEYMPFRRMDLQADGSWKAISLPLPMGEVRDIPEGALIHHSAIRRMEADPNYRPGNLIVGGGGRGTRKAPKEMGIGDWEILVSTSTTFAATR